MEEWATERGAEFWYDLVWFEQAFRVGFFLLFFPELVQRLTRAVK